MKKILILVLFWSIQNSFASDKLNNIPNLFESDIESAKLKAKTEHKGVFVLYYADWCGFCQKIFNETLPDEALQKALKAGFACYKIQNSTEEGNEFKAKYDIRSLPTLLFFDEKGELVFKQAGMQTKAKLFALINKVYDENYQKDKPREFSFTPSILPPKSINFNTKFDKYLVQVEEQQTQTIIGMAVAVPCTGTGSCNDGNACTTNDVCVNSVCVGTTITCPEDGNPCTTASCNINTGCGFSNNTSACNDGNLCTLNDVCSNGTCQAGTPLNCNDGNVCTTDVCNTATGSCTSTSNTASCNDGNSCTVNDVCSGTVCQPGTARVCNDSNACTDDSCNPATGCVFTNDNSNTCSDNNVCTINDQCSSGGCIGTDITSSCPDDNNVCTTKACNPANGCTQAYNTNACDDSDPNTTGDVCSLGVCKGQPIPSFGEVTPSGITIPKLGAFPTCDTSKKAFMFYHTGLNQVYVCNGINWVQL